MTLQEMEYLPAIGSQVSLSHPVTGEQVEGVIIIYTCSEDFGHVDGVNVRLDDGSLVDCHLYHVEVA